MALASWEPLVARAAAVFAVPAALILAVMHQENPAGDPRAARREPDGELSRGLMQVKHSTALALGLRDPRRLLDPWTGIYYGTAYLAKQLVRYRGDVASTIAAYNAGTAKRARSGAFVNQGYVDRVLGFLRPLLPLSAPSPQAAAAERAPTGILALSPVTGLALLLGAGVGLALLLAALRPRRAPA